VERAHDDFPFLEQKISKKNFRNRDILDLIMWKYIDEKVVEKRKNMNILTY